MDNKFLFRGKRIDNGEWVVGYYRKTWVGQKYKHFISNDYDEWEIDPATVGQCTGLKDKNNGKFIFEGDIVKAETNMGTGGNCMYANYIVEWAYCGFYIRYADCSRGKTKFIAYNKLSNCEIVGNIHDTPDLVQSPQSRK